jgi:hypothetical protein
MESVGLVFPVNRRARGRGDYVARPLADGVNLRITNGGCVHALAVALASSIRQSRDEARSFGRIPRSLTWSVAGMVTIHCDFPTRVSPRDARSNCYQPLLFGNMAFRVHQLSEIISHE